MEASTLIVDQVRLRRNRTDGWMERSLVRFRGNVWFGVSEQGKGESFGPVHVLHEGDEGERLVMSFPRTEMQIDGDRVGCRCIQKVDDNCLYVLALPAEYVVEELDVRLRDADVGFETAASTDFRHCIFRT